MSAPPIAAVVVKPLMKLSTVFAPRKPAATRGAEGAMAKNAPIDAMFAPSNELLIRCFAGSAIGLDDIFPASFKNATMEPVNVIPPWVIHVSGESSEVAGALTDQHTEVSCGEVQG